jgi:hypothetical protein
MVIHVLTQELIGNFFQTDTNVVVTDQLDISNNGTGPALIVSQMGANDIATFKEGSNTVMIIKDGGLIGINTQTPTATLDVNGNFNLSNYKMATIGELGIGSVRLYGSYNMTNLFDKNYTNLDLIPFAIGVRFSKF